MKRLANVAPILATALVMMFGAPSAQAAREPVLKQVDLPHSYYWRELYLPQLTSGPSSASFLPDGDTLIYSMGGSLWRQRVGDANATELTHPKAAYDYQPDASHDGRSVVFTRYDGNALELWRLDLASGREQRLTDQGAVNVEPRLSPDRKRLAWVSTQGTGHFNLFLADVDAAGLHHPHLLLGERKSTLDRYYYSAFDHAINPSWSPDGKTIYYVSNPEIGWGTGDIFAVDVDHPAQRRRVLSEETNWSARPELAPDGKRLLYASYHGRQHQQLWLTTADGAAPLPLSFGAFDRRNARWSPDGSRIAVIDNRDGDTMLRRCGASLAAGHPLIVFPEGTRSTPGQPLVFQRGAANIAVRCRAGILPVLITCDPPTLLKGEAWYKIPTRRPRFVVDIRPPLPVGDLMDPALPAALATRQLNRRLLHFYQEKLSHG